MLTSKWLNKLLCRVHMFLNLTDDVGASPAINLKQVTGEFGRRGESCTDPAKVRPLLQSLIESNNYSNSYSFLTRIFKVPTLAPECFLDCGRRRRSIVRKLKSGLCLDSFTAPEGRPRVVGKKKRNGVRGRAPRWLRKSRGG